MPLPTPDQIKSASKDVAWEYAALLGAALEMAAGHEEPLNHEVQESFLTHVRNLAVFFRSGVKEFRQNPSAPVPRGENDIYAVDFCASVQWDETPFHKKKKLLMAINKTLSHMTYSRDRAATDHAHFEGYEHVHGTVRLMSRTWGDFMKSLSPDYMRPLCPLDIAHWLDVHTRNWRIKFSSLETEFERCAKSSPHWKLNQTPDGPI